MEKIFISGLTIEHVRHLRDIKIPLTKDRMKHLIFTGKNGSGKTSVLGAVARYLNLMMVSDREQAAINRFMSYNNLLQELKNRDENDIQAVEVQNAIANYNIELSSVDCGSVLEFNQSVETIRDYFKKGQFILAYYKAERIFQADVPKHIEKVELKETYGITESPRQVFIKYLADLKVTEALFRNNGKAEKADAIQSWFLKFQELLRKIFDDDSLELLFEEETFSFYIKEKDRELFDFNTLSSGFAAVLDIVLDIIIRMEKQTNKSFDFNVPGIVLIDEIETHLHIEMQKTVLELLTTIFPNIQFVVSTHSPFILNSIQDAVIYDLEKNILVEDGLADIPYGGIVEGYFQSSELSRALDMITWKK